MDEQPRGEADIVGALAAHEERHSALYGRNPDPVYAFDLDGRLVSGNAALEQLTGYPLEELLGRPLFTLVVSEDRERAWRHFRRAARGEPQSFEVSGSDSDGREFTLLMSAFPSVVHGSISGVYGIAREITRQKEAERLLRESEERYRLLAENVQDMISLHDTSGVFLYASPSAYALLGFHPVELVGRSVYEVIEAEDVPVVQLAHMQIMKRDGRGPATFRARRADGTMGWYESTARMVTRDDSDEPWRIIAVTRDVSERRALEQHMLQAQKMEALGRLSGGVAHDFNNILTVVGGHAELLTGLLPAGSEERENAEHIRAATLRAVALTRQLLAFGRGEDSEMRPLDMNEVLLDIQPMLTRLMGSDIAVVLDLDSNLSPVRFSSASAEQVIVNLFVNARDAMPDGGELRVQTRNRTIGEGDPSPLPAGEYVDVVVTDSGTGIDAAAAMRMFDPFFTTRPGSRGSNLGLATVYRIVTHAGGTATVQSDPRDGTEFCMTLPALQSATEAAPAARHSGTAQQGTGMVMIAEDDPGVRALIVATLQRSGYGVMAAVDGAQALELHRMYGHLVDLLITDVNMPEMRGPELVTTLSDAGAVTPVLFISGYTGDTLPLSDTPPVRAFLAKPFTPAELVGAVGALLGTGGGAA